MINTARFPKLWEQTTGMVKSELRHLVYQRDRNLVNDINRFYRIKVIQDIWFSKTFVSDYNVFLSEVKAEDAELYNAIKSYLLSHSILLTEDEEEKIVRGVMHVGLASTLFGALRKNKKFLIVSLGVAALAFFYNLHNRDKVLARAEAIVVAKLEAIGNEVEKMLKKNNITR